MIKKFAAIALIAGMITGCAPTYHGGYVEHHSSRAPRYKISNKNSYSLPAQNNRKARNLEDLLGSVQILSHSVENKRNKVIHEKKLKVKYNNRLNEINQLVKEKRYSTVRSKINNFVRELQNERFSSKPTYVDIFKNFSYTRIDYVSPVYKEEYNTSMEGVVTGIIATPFAAVFTVAGTFLGQDRKVKQNLEDYKRCFAEKTKVKVKEGYYNVFKVIPYYGKEKLLENHVKDIRRYQ